MRAHKIHASIQNRQKKLNRFERDLVLFLPHRLSPVCHCIIYNIVPLSMKPDKCTTIGFRFLFFSLCSYRSVLFCCSPNRFCIDSFAHLIPFSQINIYAVRDLVNVWSISMPQLNLSLGFTHTNGLRCQCKWKIYQWNLIYTSRIILCASRSLYVWILSFDMTNRICVFCSFL